MFNFWKKRKAIAVVLVTDAGVALDSITNIYTIVSTMKEALEYIRNRLIIDNQEHFELWCNLHNCDDREETSKVNYISTVLTESDFKYGAVKAFYTKDKLTAILRMGSNCIPIGCSFDTKEEYINVAERITDIKNKLK